MQAAEEAGNAETRLEGELAGLDRELRDTAAQAGRGSRAALQVEGRLRAALQQGAELGRQRAGLAQELQGLQEREAVLTTKLSRRAPTGISGAEQLPQRSKQQDTWYETDIDNNYTKDWGPETERQISKERQTAGGNGSQLAPVYINQWEEERHSYENYHSYDQFRAAVARNPYEDDVQTVHSEGVRSELEGPPLPARPVRAPQHPQQQQEEEEEMLGMGDIGEADERVQRFYGILPKEKPIEIKTVRMVKRDNKERSSKVRRGNSEEDSESVELSVDEEEQPPPPLPRGNYQTLHSFLSHQPYEAGSTVTASPGRNHQRPNFRLGEYSGRRSAEPGSRPGSALSAHERLFGSVRDSGSLSPDLGPGKPGSSVNSSDSGQSTLQSPVFKSAAARAIIEEERKTPVIIPKARKKNKKRHLTITSSHPAVMEAITRHDAKLERARLGSRDDIDIERSLKPARDAPDVVQSTYGQADDFRVENIFGAPNKINIPERRPPSPQVSF